MNMRWTSSRIQRSTDADQSLRPIAIDMLVLCFCVAMASFSFAQTAVGPVTRFTTIGRFNNVAGQNPYTGLVQGRDGDLYGTTLWEGGEGGGTIFKVTPKGVLTTLYNFCSSDACSGGKDGGGMVLAADGNFYGTTYYGGVKIGVCAFNGCGTIFKMSPEGAATTLYRFTGGDDCQFPQSLLQARDGNFYGVALGSINGGSCGTIFKVTDTGVMTILHSFELGTVPISLTQGRDGNFYGTTLAGGVSNKLCGNELACGTVFVFKPNSAGDGGDLTTLYSFCSQANCADGWRPSGRLVESGDGSFYGTTSGGGSHDSGTVFAFKLNPEGDGGRLTTLHSFCSQPKCIDGANPYAGLIQGADGDFYGTTVLGGDGGPGYIPSSCLFDGFGCGTVFRITPAGALTTLYNFCSLSFCADGYLPDAGLVQGKDGKFYGTTTKGGDKSELNLYQGTAFSLEVRWVF